MALYLSRIFRYILKDYRRWKAINNARNGRRDLVISDEAELRGDVELGQSVIIGAGVLLRGNIKIGRATLINGPSHFAAGRDTRISVGSFCSFADYTYVITGNHPMDFPATYATSSGAYKNIFSNKGLAHSIEIGNDVWVGAHAVILSGVRIGNGAIVGAGSVVTGDVPPYAVVAGVPARILKMRFDERQIKALNELEWWAWSDERMKRNLEFFKSKLGHEWISEGGLT